MAHEHRKRPTQPDEGETNHYIKLLVMVALSFGAMYILMYSMVNTYSDVHHNVNQVYMAGLMAAPMAAIELIVMRGMYTNTRRNLALIAGSLLVAVACFAGIRRQFAIGDGQFLRSMIPHHSSAILMCREATIEDRRIKELCSSIILGQQAEIDQMRTLLNR
jgi:uncharacterized protein (DUF305 family)